MQVSSAAHLTHLINRFTNRMTYLKWENIEYHRHGIICQWICPKVLQGGQKAPCSSQAQQPAVLDRLRIDLAIEGWIHLAFLLPSPWCMRSPSPTLVSANFVMDAICMRKYLSAADGIGAIVGSSHKGMCIRHS